MKKSVLRKTQSFGNTIIFIPSLNLSINHHKYTFVNCPIFTEDFQTQGIQFDNGALNHVTSMTFIKLQGQMLKGYMYQLLSTIKVSIMEYLKM